MKLCVVIPVYNQVFAIEATVAVLRKKQLFCILVDDGSNNSTTKVLERIVRNHSDVELIIRQTNGGKGAAVCTGFRQAWTLGFTHVLQIDADGQHDLDDVERFTELATLYPKRLICGQPLFDESIPPSRKIARNITHFWVAVETLTLSPVDSMCGYRVYPLDVVMPLLSSIKLSQRMDFDIEILVRLIWRGMAVETIPTRVIYPEEGSSSFRLFRDNVLIFLIHSKLVVGMLINMPKLILRKFNSPKKLDHWSEVKETGSQWGINILLLVYKLLGRSVVSLLLFPIIFYFFLSSGQARHASKRFLEKVHAAGLAQAVLSPKPSWRHCFNHFLEFGRCSLDRVSSWLGDIRREDIEVNDRVLLDYVTSQQSGAVIIGSHLGNIELCRALAQDMKELKINVLVHTENALKFNAMLKKVAPQDNHHLIHISQIGPDTAIMLHEKVQRGELIFILGDRTPPKASLMKSRTCFVEFLNETAVFPQGPIILSALLKCPVYLFFCLKEERKYKIYLEKFSDKILLNRSRRDIEIKAHVQRYAKRLEFYCLKAPYQWFNFFDIWDLKNGVDTLARAILPKQDNDIAINNHEKTMLRDEI